MADMQLQIYEVTILPVWEEQPAGFTRPGECPSTEHQRSGRAIADSEVSQSLIGHLFTSISLTKAWLHIAYTGIHDPAKLSSVHPRQKSDKNPTHGDDSSLLRLRVLLSDCLSVVR
ncbi:hypothetical protein CVT25_007212 [Psilocybe cyanescens]|uniref:Uncharacterized protein n=1 Tax=Psilocybe cyanescens TaxID=93625 RepID=A0A409X774_PSICY|nr:hypothetical protein CVT25_007212 [Psilocybe cyanescens]